MTSGERHSPSTVAAVTDYSLPTLSSATSHKVKVSREYKSGASYQGDLKDNQRCGLGLFSWPNGAKYEGEFIDNDRHGKGAQDWPDGSRYEGEFVNNLRHGDGHHTWANGETYIGRFFRDRRHGAGTYTWPDGSKYVGTFYMDKKEGYGAFYFNNGKVFEGLYGSDERYGPGVLTYPDSTADVGLWHREKLVRLSATCPGAFTIQDHPEVEFFPEEHARFIDALAVRNRTDLVEHIVHPPEQFNYPPGADIEDMAHREIFSDTLHFGSLAVDVQIFDEEFFKDVRKKVEEESSSEQKVMVKAWNNTPSSLAMQGHILRHESRCHTVSFSVQDILDGERSKFAEKGSIEKASEAFLVAGQNGDASVVSEMLNKDLVYVDVCDMRGHTALLGAAVNWHQGVVNTLLDNGADVNRLNNECVSPLAACHIHFYPVDCFKYNIAERYLKAPKDLETEECYDVNDSVKALIPTSPTKKRLIISTSDKKSATQPTPPNINSKKIHRLRQEYKTPNLGPIKEGNKSTGGETLTAPEEDKENEHQDEQEDEVPEEEEVQEEEESEVFDTPEEQLEPRTLGTLQVRRATKINMEDMLVKHPRMDTDMMKKMNRKSSTETFDAYSETEMSEFESIKSLRNLPIDVSDGLIERCATQLSQNDMVVGRQRTRHARIETMGTVRRLAIDKSHQELMQSTIQLLLCRGADPNSSSVPMPVLFYAIKAADVAAVRLLLMKGASTCATLSEKKGGLYPIHIAAAIPGEEGIAITELLLNALASPDARAALDDTYLNHSLEEEWSKDAIHPSLKSISGGRTSLHIACARDDNYKNACRVVHLLLAHHGNPNLLCNGHSPLALAVASGNDLAIDELLSYGADPCLPLTHGVGSALCIASNTEYEYRRSPPVRIHLIDKLIRSGADILSPILIGPKRVMGTAVDYAYYMYNLDRRIAHMPYHALTPAERETYNARRRLLAHMGDVLRHKAVERERRRLEDEDRQGRRSISPSPNFTYTGAGAPLPPGIIKGRSQKGASAAEGRVSFGGALMAVQTPGDGSDSEIRKPLFRYCYECGRSVGVRLSACTRCKEVYYCSKACKLKAWNARHKDECVRVGGRSCSPSPNRGGARIDSPTPATDPDQGAPTTVAGISGEHIGNRIKDKGRRKKSKKHNIVSDDESDDGATHGRTRRENKKKRGAKSKEKKQDLDDGDESETSSNGQKKVVGSKSKKRDRKGKSRKKDDPGSALKKSKPKKWTVPEEDRIPDSTDSDSDEKSDDSRNGAKTESTAKGSSDSDSSSDSSGKEEQVTEKNGGGTRSSKERKTSSRRQRTICDDDSDYSSDDIKRSNKSKTRTRAWEENLDDGGSDSERKKTVKSSQRKKSKKPPKKKNSEESFDYEDDLDYTNEKRGKRGKKVKSVGKSGFPDDEKLANSKEKTSKEKKTKALKENKKGKSLRLNLGDSDDEFSFGQRRARPSYDLDLEDKKSKKSKKKSQDPYAAEADWMSPRKHYQNSKMSRLDDDWLAMGSVKKKQKKKEKVGKQWRKEGSVSMLHPRIERPKTTHNFNNKTSVVKVHREGKRVLPPILEPSSGVTHYSHMSPSMRVTMATMAHQKSRLHDNGTYPSPPGILATRSHTFAGAEGLRKENIKLKMKISVRSKQSVGRSDSGVTGHVVPYAMATAALSKVAMKGRSRSAVVPGQKFRGKQKDGLLPRLANNAQAFHGLTTPQYALSVLPGLQGLQDLQRYKHVYVDNYSFN